MRTPFPWRAYLTVLVIVVLAAGGIYLLIQASGFTGPGNFK